MIETANQYLGWSKLSLPRTIVALFENDALKIKLENWAEQNNCRIHWATSCGSDIYAVGCFVMIVDRSLLGPEVYNHYLQWCKGTMDVQIIEEAIINHTEEREVIWQQGDKVISSEQNTCWRDEFCDDVCIFVDDMIELPLPQTKLVHVIHPGAPRFKEWVIQDVMMALKTVFERIDQQGER